METDREESLDIEDLDDEETGDLEKVMREALEAVENARQKADPGEDDGEGGSAAPLIAPVEFGEEGESLDELLTLRKEVAELRDRSVRTLADFDNFRKRAERERLEQQRYAGTEVLRDTLDVVDNLERALGADGEFEDLKAGVELILRQVLDMLTRHGVERVKAEGRIFDPSVHEAVSRQEDAEVPVPTVREELQAGYLLRERLLRPAMVVVAVPPPTAAPLEDAD